MIQMPEFTPELCNGCGLCTQVCQGGGLIMGKGQVRVLETEKCNYCGDCEAVCPTGALNLPYQIVRPPYSLRQR
jgi:NAD-dependent dihydropyrimidine dehydrogenase PreA subunit